MLLLGPSVSILNIYINYLLLWLNGNKLFTLRNRITEYHVRQLPHLYVLSKHGQANDLSESCSCIRNIRTLIPVRAIARADALLGMLLILTATTLCILSKF